MKSRQAILAENAEFVREGKARVKDIQNSIAGIDNLKEFSETLDVISSYINEFGVYGEMVEDGEVSTDSLKDFDFFPRFEDYLVLSGSTRHLRYQYNGKDRQPDDDYMSLFTIPCCLSCMNLIPTLIMDNAVKYSPWGSEITINLEEDEYCKTISVSNLGPKLESDEIESILSTDQHTRGYWAIRSTIEGHGIGLRQAYWIFKAHPWLDADISISSSSTIRQIYRIPFSNFTIHLFFSKRVEPAISIEMDISLLRKSVADFIFHEYLRVNPYFCRLVNELSLLLPQTSSPFSGQSLVLKSLVYRLKKLVMEHMIQCYLEDGDIKIRNDEELEKKDGRLDTLLCSNLEEDINIKSLSIFLSKRHLKGFHVPRLTISLSVFFYLFADYVTTIFSSGGTIVVSSDYEVIELEFPSTTRLKKYDDRRLEIMEYILEIHGLQMNTNFFRPLKQFKPLIQIKYKS